MVGCVSFTVLPDATVTFSSATHSGSIGNFKDAYLIYPVSVLSESFAVKRVNPDKYYIVDTGLLSAVSPKTDTEKGWQLEKLVYMTLRRGMRKIHYYPLDGTREVDFHVYNQLNGKFSLIQVAWDITNEKTFSRENSAKLIEKCQHCRRF